MNKGTICVNKFENYQLSVAGAVGASRIITPNMNMGVWLKRQLTYYPILSSDISDLVSKKHPGGPVERLANSFLNKFKRDCEISPSIPVIYDGDKYIFTIVNIYRGKPVKLGGGNWRFGDTVLDLHKEIDKKTGAACTFCRYSFDGVTSEHDGALPLLFFARVLNAASPNQEFLPAIRSLEQNIADAYEIAPQKESVEMPELAEKLIKPGQTNWFRRIISGIGMTKTI